jgi:hypothetical protein
MALGDGIRRNIAHVDPSERALLRDAFIQLNHRFFPGSRNDSPPGGVSWWFKQDEIHQATHVHGGPEFLPWHREIVNRLEEMLRQINPQLSLHYWDWTQDPRSIPNANLGGGTTGNLNLFTPDFMGYGGSSSQPIGEPWLSAGYYKPGANPERDTSGNPADPPLSVNRHVSGSPAAVNDDNDVINAPNFPTMRGLLENIHNAMHGFVSMGSAHISFRDPFVFLLHSNVDRLYAMWQAADPSSRFDPGSIYGTEGISPSVLDEQIPPWSGSPPSTRPWAPPENQQAATTYKSPSVIAPPCYDTLPTNIIVNEVLNPGSVIHFNDVPEGETTARAAVFHIFACSDVTLEVKPMSGPNAPFSVLTPGAAVVVHHPLRPYAEGRIWFGMTGGSVGTPIPTGNVIIRCVQTGQEFPFTLVGNTIARPKVAVVLALDQSGSMDDPAGTMGAKRVEVLRDAALHFVELVQPNNGVGIIRFDHDAYATNDPNFPGLPVTQMTGAGMLDPNRIAARAAVQAHQTNLMGATSVGDGVAMARATINPVTGYDQKAIIVFTDGIENSPQTIASAAALIDQQTFAVGLGSETQVNTAALRALANGTGGYLLLTGLLSASIDDYFRLSKYFLQILAGVTNTNIVVDPTGYISPGTKLRIPFRINEADIDATVLLLTDLPVVNLTVETPNGTHRVDPGNAASLGAVYAVGTNLKYYRYTLPVALGTGVHEGTWHALLEIDDKIFRRNLAKFDNDQVALNRLRSHGARFCLNVHSYSNLRFTARLDQNSLQPGATFTLRAVLTEYGIPVAGRATVRAEVILPDKSTSVLTLRETAPGIFEAATPANISGIYVFRLIAAGSTLRGRPFTREQTLTGAVFQGGDGPSPFGGDDPHGQHDRFCHLLECLLTDKGVEAFLKEKRIDVHKLAGCLKHFCEAHQIRESVEKPGASRPVAGGGLETFFAHPKLRDALTEVLQKAGSDISPDAILKEPLKGCGPGSP